MRKQIRNLPKILNFVKKIHYYKYGARPARAFPLVANKQHQAVISEISEIGWLRRLAGTARLAVLAA